MKKIAAAASSAGSISRVKMEAKPMSRPSITPPLRLPVIAPMRPTPWAQLTPVARLAVG
ncbi:hypothetical protein D3C84_1286950 [compost metagenome]